MCANLTHVSTMVFANNQVQIYGPADVHQASLDNVVTFR